MSPTMACVPTMRPPPPSPCSARNPMSWTMVWLSPEQTDPARKIKMAAWKKTFRPYWSPSFPHSGVDTVAASR